MENCKRRDRALSVVVLVVVFIGVGVATRLAWAGNPFKGETLYTQRCMQCHGNKGQDVLPGVPDFSWRGRGNDGLMMMDEKLLARIRIGGRGCPGFQGILTDLEILDVITHLRTLR